MNTPKQEISSLFFIFSTLYFQEYAKKILQCFLTNKIALVFLYVYVLVCLCLWWFLPHIISLSNGRERGETGKSREKELGEIRKGREREREREGTWKEKEWETREEGEEKIE